MNRNIHYINIIIGILIIIFPIVSSPNLSLGISMFSAHPFQRSILSYMLILIFYITNFYYFVPQYYINKRYVIYALICLLAFLVISFLPELVFSRPSEFGHMRRQGPHGPKPVFRFEKHIIQFILAMGLSLLLRINIQLDKIRNEKLKTELSFIKAKINPHFLFNTLNSLYSLAIKKSDETEDAILKISNIMRYMVSESEKDYVPLSKELSYIKDYIELQKLRLDKNTKLTVTISDCPGHLKIAPLMLITFIENAFKYGVNPEEPSTIMIDISCEEGILFMKTKNTIVTSSNAIEDQSTQTGSKTIIRMLKTLYLDKFTLATEQQNNYYSVHLKIDLT